MGIILDLLKESNKSKSKNKKPEHIVKGSDKTIEKALDKSYSERDYCEESKDYHLK